MPRVVNPPQKSHGRGSSKQVTTPRKNSPMKIPLNDDAGEKVARFQSRQALHDLQMNQIKAAVKTPMPPMRKINSYDRASSSSPRTPRGSGARTGGRETDSGGRQIVNGRAVTPMKRVPILANFEEWMKMATDNKINAANSWNFALIDYFHDMSLLKEGDGVNFQKASCTLDGCVKIYTSRVDSVATETGKLLSGLADSNNKKRQQDEGEGGEGDNDEDDEEEETGEDGTKRKKQKKTRSHESTLAPSFASLQLKKFELEFAVDPLFKKASADFDEGGAKGLLLNHLSIDGTGRIVFDSSDDACDATPDGDWNPRKDGREGTAETDAPPSPSPAPQTNGWDDENVEIDLGPLANKFFSNLDSLDEQDICPSLKDFDLGDPSGSIDIPFLRAPDDWRQDKSQLEPGVGDASGIMLDDDIAVGFDDDDGTITGFDLGGDTGFGEGGEAWAREAALEPMLKVHRIDGGDEGMDSDSNDPYTISLSHQPAAKEHDNILSYFDNALQKNWAGPEHWKIRRIKEVTTTSTNAAPRIRKEKEPFEIDFASPLDPTLAEMIYSQSSSNSAISLPKTQWKTKGRNLLPDDKHFNSRELLRLFLKPKARMGFKSLGKTQKNKDQQNISNNNEMDEAFWAAHKSSAGQTSMDESAAPTGTYDANFFADDEGLAFPHGLPMGGDGDDDNLPFADAREAFSPAMDPNARPSTAAGEAGGLSGLTALLNAAATPGGALAGGFGSQLVTQGGRRVRPEYVAYARVAKKVDVRRLKEEMWKGMGDRLIASSAFSSSSPSAAVTSIDSPKHTEIPTSAPAEPTDQTQDDAGEDEKSLRFTSLMQGLKSAYPEQALRDISTSYCFICLLHLANEKGLVLENKGGMDGWGGKGLEEIYVTKDPGAVIEGEA
ncbi:condensin complex component cnd2 [Histoplasma capsulatum var. duboisii H88]|uniref:Condensin complex subunit 2 n=2 Tax=Ajellomyces capsulatus TaxID=5037 RepID=F0UBU2_AJEC8|nr:condensin complex component cnd2 [Histoplasma capsulatum H143]EGC43941.1 condensin complex component cnd2 [Histoplasma capsulatum var. duboisii H88]QSS50104.1 condensin complex component cnd2 [Histoplasma capsulatum var. duboisii H88]